MAAVDDPVHVDDTLQEEVPKRPMAFPQDYLAKLFRMNEPGELLAGAKTRPPAPLSQFAQAPMRREQQSRLAEIGRKISFIENSYGVSGTSEVSRISPTVKEYEDKLREVERLAASKSWSKKKARQLKSDVELYPGMFRTAEDPDVQAQREDVEVAEIEGMTLEDPATQRYREIMAETDPDMMSVDLVGVPEFAEQASFEEDETFEARVKGSQTTSDGVDPRARPKEPFSEKFKITDKDLTKLKNEVDDLAAYTPLGRHAEFYEKTQNRIRTGTNAALQYHDDNKLLVQKIQDNLDKKAAHEAGVLAAEEGMAEAKANRLEADKGSVEEFTNDFIKQNRVANVKIGKMMEQITADRTMGWGDWVSKSAIALGAVAAIAGQVVGQAALAKYGGMPNVLLPLILKAIDADIKSMETETKDVKDRAGVLVKLYDELRKVYDDSTLAVKKSRIAMFDWWDSQLEALKKKRPLSEEATYEEIRNKLKIQQNNEMIQFEKSGVSIASGGAKVLVEGLERSDKLKTSNSARLTAKVHNYQFLHAMSRDPDEKKNRGDLKGANLTDYNFGTQALQMIPSLKADMVELLDDFGVTEWEQIKDLKFSEFFGRFENSPQFVKLQGLVGRLKQFGQIYAKFYENGRISEGDRAFWQETMAADLNNVNIIHAFSRLVGAEYFSRSNVLLSAAKMSPFQLAQETQTLSAALTSNNIPRLMKDHAASIFASNKAMAEGSPYSPHNVGMAAVEEAYAFKNQFGARMQEAIQGQYMSNIQAPHDTTPVRRNVLEAIDSGASATGPLAGFMRIDTTKGDIALMEPKMGKQFLKMQDFARRSGVTIMPSGGRAGARSKEQIQGMLTEIDPATGKLKFQSDPKGAHTEHGDYTGVDITVHDSENSREYQWLKLHGAKFGFYPSHKRKKTGTHWHHFVYDESKITGAM